VHGEGAPASKDALASAKARLGELPSGLAALVRAWDGLSLFTDSVVLRRLDEIELAEVGDRRLLIIGEMLGGLLWLDAEGRVYEADDDGDPIGAAPDLPRWLKATVAREGLLVDTHGEWRDVFDGEELTTEVRRKRLRVGAKTAPSARLELEAAELALEEGDADEAGRAAERAVTLDPHAGAAWALLGGLRNDPAAWAAAASATTDAELRAERFGEAARAARAAPDLAAQHAASARAASPSAAAAWAVSASALADDGDIDGAARLAERAAAVEPEHATLAAKIRARRSLAVL
jgi:tetratricopeptide (TPR) repeat protein